MAKTLVAFYSRRGENWVDGGVRFLPKGNNEVIVEKIKSQLPEAEVFQIETVKKYSDTIILGYPNWWGVPPMAVFTFLESYDFSGKKIVPFCSHEGSGLGGSIRQIKMAVPEADLTAGVAIHGAAASHCDREVNLILAQATL